MSGDRTPTEPFRRFRVCWTNGWSQRIIQVQAGAMQYAVDRVRSQMVQSEKLVDLSVCDRDTFVANNSGIKVSWDGTVIKPEKGEEVIEADNAQRAMEIWATHPHQGYALPFGCVTSVTEVR